MSTDQPSDHIFWFIWFPQTQSAVMWLKRRGHPPRFLWPMNSGTTWANPSRSSPRVPHRDTTGMSFNCFALYFWPHTITLKLFPHFCEASPGTTRTASMRVLFPTEIRPTTCRQVSSCPSLWVTSSTVACGWRKMSDRFLRLFREGNGNYQNAFSSHESQSVTHSHQPVWGENTTQNINSTWDTSKVRSTAAFGFVTMLEFLTSLKNTDIYWATHCKWIK